MLPGPGDILCAVPGHLSAEKNVPPPRSCPVLGHVLRRSSCGERFDLDLPVTSIKTLDAGFKRLLGAFDQPAHRLLQK